jgi:2,3-bisphosphoglycerate-dependent phosphoglycerate mutase
MIKNIYLLRHGETDFNKQWIMQGGGVNSSLNDLGREQANKVSHFFFQNSVTFDRVFVSPLNRAKETAEIVTQKMQVPLEYDEILKEISCGVWEGKSLRDVDGVLLDKLRNDPYQQYPEGESCYDVIQRSKKFITKTHLLEEESILVVSHGNFIRCITTALLDTSPDFAVKVFMDNCGLTHLSLFDKHYKLMYWNRIVV